MVAGIKIMAPNKYGNFSEPIHILIIIDGHKLTIVVQ